MGLFDIVRDIQVSQGINKSHEFNVFDSADPLATMQLFNTRYETQYRDELVRRVYENIIWTYRCVRIIAEGIAGLPIKIKDPNEKDITQSPEFGIFQRPNPYQTRFDFIMESISRLLLQGELFWYLDRPENSRKVVAIYADWRSEEVQIIPDPQGYIKGYKRTVNGKETTIPADDVFFIKLFNPYNAYRGLSPIRVGKHISELEISALVFNKKFFNEGMKSSGVFSTDKTLDLKEARKLKKEIAKHYGGLENMWEPLMLWGGLKFQSLNNMSLQDAEFSTMRKMNREEIAALFGVPIELLSIGKDTYENVKEARKMLWTDTNIPMLNKIVALINTFLMPKLSQRKAEFEFDLSVVDVLHEGIDTIWERLKDGFDRGAVTPDELRVHGLNLDPLNKPETQSLYMPANLIPVTEISGKGKAVEDGEFDEDEF